MVSESVWGDENLRNMAGDITTSEGLRGGSEELRRQHFVASKNTSILLLKWKRTALSEHPTFSDFYVVSNEFDSDVLNRIGVMISECITGKGINFRL